MKTRRAFWPWPRAITDSESATAEGYSSPGGRWPSIDLIGYLQPAIITGDGRVPFWFVLDDAPPDDVAATYYRRLGKQRNETFPVRWSVTVQVPDGAAPSGEIHAFSGLIWSNGEFAAFDRT